MSALWKCVQFLTLTAGRAFVVRREFMKNHRDCALLEKFLIFGRVLGMGLRFL